MSASRRKGREDDSPRDIAIAVGFVIMLICFSAILGAIIDRFFLPPATPAQNIINIPASSLPACNVLVQAYNPDNTPVPAPKSPSVATLYLANTYPDNASSFFHFNCTNSDEVNWVTNYLAKLIPYKTDHYDCTQFSRALIANLTHYGCTARMVRGYYMPEGENYGRTAHNWVETPDFIIEATPEGQGILNVSTYGLHYAKVQSYDWNQSTLCGE